MNSLPVSSRNYRTAPIGRRNRRQHREWRWQAPDSFATVARPPEPKEDCSDLSARRRAPGDRRQKRDCSTTWLSVPQERDGEPPAATSLRMTALCDLQGGVEFSLVQ